jgi:hypothetical protein
MRRTGLFESPPPLSHTATNNGNSSDHDSVVKSLLFPSFAAAGANHAFETNKASNNNAHPVTGGGGNGRTHHNHHHLERADSVVMSEASTAVADNRTIRTRNIIYHQHPQHARMSVPPSPPSSPPKVSRVALIGDGGGGTGEPHRSISNSAVVSFPFSDDDHNSIEIQQQGTDETLYQDAHSVAIVAVASNDAGDNNAEVNDGDEGSNSANTTPTIDRAVSILDSSPSSSTSNQYNMYEEEATPAQTAFGKELLFQRVLDANSNDDDVLSTASEMGTVIDEQRMADVDDDPRDEKCAAVAEKNTTTMQALTHAELRERSPGQSLKGNNDDGAGDANYSEPVWDEDDEDDDDLKNNNLSLPVLFDGMGDNNSNKEVRFLRPFLSGGGKDNPKTFEQELDNEDAPHSQSEPSGILDAPVSPTARSNNPATAPKTATEILSQAIRRLGSGFAGNGPNNNTTTATNAASRSYRNYSSAPTTPRASYGNSSNNAPQSPNDVQQPHRPNLFVSTLMSPSPERRSGSTATQSPEKRFNSSSLPSSFLLRSPGSSAFQAASRIRPRRSQQHTNDIGQIPEDDEISLQPKSLPNNNNNNAFQIARSCFSFDDTSMDDQYTFTVPNRDYEAPAIEPPSMTRTVFPDRRNSSIHRRLKTSASWDVDTEQRPAFRPRSHRFVTGGIQSVASSPTRKSMMIMMTGSDLSPSKSAMVPQQLKTPQRLEIEREDALDILACLVERGVSWKQTNSAVTGKDASENALPQDSAENVPGKTTSGTDDTEVSSTASLSDIAAVVKELQELSLAEESSQHQSNKHEKRKHALEELLRSHEYAMEMKRVSQSASCWLKSIGRSHSVSATTSASPNKAPSPQKAKSLSADSPVRSELSLSDGNNESQQAAGEESSGSDNIDLLTAKAMLHSAQMEIKEKTELAERLNEELVRFLRRYYLYLSYFA